MNCHRQNKDTPWKWKRSAANVTVTLCLLSHFPLSIWIFWGGMQVIFDCRFFTLMAVMGSLAGSLLCFFKVKPHFFHLDSKIVGVGGREQYLVRTWDSGWTQRPHYVNWLMSGPSNRCALFTRLHFLGIVEVGQELQIKTMGRWSWSLRHWDWRPSYYIRLLWNIFEFLDGYWATSAWVKQGSFFVVESFMEYFQASWQGLGTSQVVFLLVEAVGRLPSPFSCIFTLYSEILCLVLFYSYHHVCKTLQIPV